MRKITEVLRLKAAGISIRDIAASVGAGRTTVYAIAPQDLRGPRRCSPERRRAQDEAKGWCGQAGVA